MTPADVARRRLGGELAAQGRPFAAFAATVLACRGRLLLDRGAFARLLGVPTGHLRALESGWRPPDHAPRRLARLLPDLGWPDVGLDAAAPDDRADRHPSNGRARRAGGDNGPP